MFVALEVAFAPEVSLVTFEGVVAFDEAVWFSDVVPLDGVPVALLV